MALSVDKTSHSRTAPRKPRGQVYINAEFCKGCGFCVEFCPFDVLEMSNDYNSKGYHFPRVRFPDKCTGCDLCGQFCPDFAIFAKKRLPVQCEYPMLS